MQRLCSKHEMAHRLNILKSVFPDVYDFYPNTWTFSYSTRKEAQRQLSEREKEQQNSGLSQRRTWYLVKTSTGRQGTADDIERASSELLKETNEVKRKRALRRRAKQLLEEEEEEEEGEEGERRRRRTTRRGSNEDDNDLEIEIREKTDQSLVLQEYNDRPLLLNGFKFDFRVFAIVTSLEPFEFY
ncbi:hypothetical protein RFI_23470, partial [Reticulomyxa filosa]